MTTIDTIESRWGNAAVIVGPSVSAFTYKALMAIETVYNAVINAAEIRRSRRALAMLSDQQLDDIGISRAEAVREANRSLWH